MKKWWAPAFFGSMILLGMVLMLIATAPGKWDNATAIGVCDGRVVLRRTDGTVWLRVNGLRRYQIEGDWKEICR